MGELHHMERRETGPEAVPKLEPDQSEEGMLPSATYAVKCETHRTVRKGLGVGCECTSFHHRSDSFIR